MKILYKLAFQRRYYPSAMFKEKTILTKDYDKYRIQSKQIVNYVARCVIKMRDMHRATDNLYEN